MGPISKFTVQFSCSKIVDMDTNQSRIIELLREVHLIAFKEIERLNLRIVELENKNRHTIEKPIVKPAIHTPSTTTPPEMMNDLQVAEYLNVSVSTLRRWRLLNQGPKYLKIGAAVRYKRGDVETWMESLPGLR